MNTARRCTNNIMGNSKQRKFCCERTAYQKFKTNCKYLGIFVHLNLKESQSPHIKAMKYIIID